MAAPPVPGAANRTSYTTVDPQAFYDALARAVTPGRTETVRRQAEVLANAMQGKLNVGGVVTLTGTVTTLSDSRIGNQSILLFMPTTAAGCTALNSLTVAARTKGQAVLDHSSSTATLEYVVLG